MNVGSVTVPSVGAREPRPVPGHPTRMNMLRRCAYRATGAALLALVVGGCAKPAPSGGRTAPDNPTPPMVGKAPCTPSPVQAGPPLTGPALSSLTGGPARQAFSLDSGALVVDPPRSGDLPSVPASVARCDALASIDTNGEFGDFTAGGMVIGYARVTVRTDLLSDAGPLVGDDSSVSPTAAPPPAYQDRLAWVLVVHRVVAASCPAQLPGSVRSAPPPRKTDYGYDVFLLDAATGGAALTYAEGGPSLCGGPDRYQPMIAVPMDQVSVPWTPVSRDKNGYSGRITADMTSCDGYDDVAQPDEDTPATLRVLVWRPIGSACPAVRRTLTLHAATVTSDLPAHLAHAPTGLVLPGAPPPVRATTPSQGTLLNLQADQCGKSITVSVDTVLVLPFDPGATERSYPYRSSAPSVLGPLGGPLTGPVVELRAWRPGAADVTVVSRLPGEPATCATPWTLHVTVR